MSRVDEPGICYCSCHEYDENGFTVAIHCVPCCSPCPVCKKNLERFGADDHVAACQKRLADLIEQHERAIETHDIARSQGEF